MRRIATAGVLLLMTATAGCYSTTSLLGDSRTDATPDTVDAVTDTAVDPHVEPPTDVGPESVTDVMPACPEPNPPPDGPEPYFDVDGTAWPVGSGELSVYCTVASVAEGDDHSVTVDITCGDIGERHTLYMRSERSVWIDVIPDEPVYLWYVWDDGWWDLHRWFLIWGEWSGAVVFGGEGRDLSVLEEDGPSLGPAEVEVFEGVCELERDECGTFERTGLRVTLSGAVRDFHDRTSGLMGTLETLQVIVGRSFVYHDMECDDFPDRYVSFIVAYAGSF